MIPFTYEGKEFTELDQVEEYSNSFYDGYGNDGFDHDAASESASKFYDCVRNHIFKLLHKLTLETNPNSDAYEKLKDEIVDLGTIIDFFCDCYDCETTEYDLEDGWANRINYFRDEDDKTIMYAMAYTESPYYGIEDPRFYAVKEVQKVVTAYEEIESKYDN